MTSEAVLELIDHAPAFVEPEPLSAEDLRKAGLVALDAEIQRLRTTEGQNARGNMLQEVAHAAGAIAGAGAVDESFAKALLLDAAAGVGLIKDLGAKAVKSTIAAAMKAGKKLPRDFSAPIMSQLRPGEAGNSAAVHVLPSPEDTPAAVPAAPAPSRPPDSTHPPTSLSSPSPAPLRGEANSQAPKREITPMATLVEGAGGDGGWQPPERPEDGGARNMRLAFFPLTDLGNAERFRERYKHRLLWCPALGWLAWDGRRWSRDGAEELVKIAEHDTVRAIQDEAEEVEASGRNDVLDPKPGARDWMFDADKGILYSDKIARWGRSSEAANKLGALSKRGAPYFAVSIDKLDADKMMINVRNGTLVVSRRSESDYVAFKPHDPRDLITKLAPVDYDPAAPRPAFDAFLAKVQPRAEMRAFIQQWLGLSLTGDVTEQLLAFFYGKGGNGKSVLIDAVSFVAGDYGETVPIETFLDHGKARGGGQATPDLAILPGVRFLRTSEPEKGAKLAEAMVKLVTGGEPIQARHLNRDFFKFYPQFKLTMSGNYRPTISGTDEGIWRRVRLVPFGVTIPKEERDIHLHEKLRAEASGILNWLLDGLRVWIDKGLHEPEDVLQATAEYRSASDPLGRFLSQCVVDSIGDRTQSSVLHQVYEAWCASSGENAWKNRGFSLAMDERGYKRKQSDVVWWLGIKLIKGVNDFVDHDGKPIRVKDDGKKEDIPDGDREF